MTSRLAGVDITRDFIRSKRPCADGYRWYLRRQELGSNYQALLNDLVAEGRLDDAVWLLSQLGPSNELLVLNGLEAEALVFAGTVQCRGNVEIGRLLKTGRSLQVEGGVKVGADLQVGEDLRVSGALRCGGSAQLGSDARVAWHLEVAERLVCKGHLRVGWDLDSGSRLQIGGNLRVGRDLRAGSELDCEGSVTSGGDLHAAGAVRVRRGIDSGGGILCESHLQADWGIRATADIEAGGGIRAGESLQAGGRIVPGPQHGIYAGLAVPLDAWESSAYVRAGSRPERLISGWWDPLCVKP